MTRLTNPAKRILELAQEARSKPDNSQLLEIWGEVFGLEKETIKNDSHLVYEKLALVRSELDLLLKLMNETAFSPSLYEPYLKRIRNTISVNNLSIPWAKLKNNLQDDTLLAIKYCSEILPSESDIDPQDLEKILATIKKLQSELENSSLSAGMYRFLCDQLVIIEHAIQSYPITGGSAIKKAFAAGFTNLAENADNISHSNEQDKEKLNEVAGIWSALKSAGKEFVEANRIATAYSEIIEKGQKASEAVIGLLNQ